jgi:hypothetical protein
MIASLLNDPARCMKNPTSWLLLANLAIISGTLLVPVGCGSGNSHPSLPGGAAASPSSGGKSGGSSNGDGGSRSGGDANAGGSAAGDSDPGGAGPGASGDSAGGQPTNGDVAGAASGGAPDVVVSKTPFNGSDPFPCSTDGAAAPAYAAQCSPNGTWGAGAKVMADAAAGAALIGVTPDELSIVWAEGASSVTAYYVADRDSPSAAFGSKTELPATAVVALSPDGLRVVQLSDAQDALLVLSRADRASAFGSAEAGEFSVLNADAAAKGGLFSSCVFAPDDRTLYYTFGGPDERYPLHVSTRSGSGPWPVGQAVEQCELEAHAGYGRYPTGVSSDGKTLFFYDSWRVEARAAWRAASSGPFTWFRDFGDLFVPQPNDACDRLYYSAADPAASIVSAPAQ